MKDEQDGDVKDLMIDHMIELMEDAHDFSWAGAKSAWFKSGSGRC